MFVSILCAGTAPLYYNLLDKRINELIEKTRCFLFTILCGRIAGQEKKEKTLGQLWAEKNGAPVKYITANTIEELVRKLFYQTDYAFFILTGDPFINNLFMQYKMTGKHGTVICA